MSEPRKPMTLDAKMALVPSTHNVRQARHIAQFVDADAFDMFNTDGRRFTLDSNALTAAFAREFEFMETEIQRTVFAPLKGELLVPYQALGGPGQDSVTYRKVTTMGRADWIGNTGAAMNRVDAVGDEYTRKAYPIGAEYSISIFDLMRAAQNPAINLETERKEAAMQAIMRKHSQIALQGDTAKSFYGLFNEATVAGSLVSPITGTWSGATPENIIKDINKLLWAPYNATLENESPDTLVLPLQVMELLDRPILTGGAYATVLDFIKAKSHFKINIECAVELNTGNVAGNGNRAIAYRKNPSVVRYGAQATFREEAAQKRGLDVVIPCWGKTSGTQVKLPKAIAYMDGI
jgi:hypothetical protein